MSNNVWLNKVDSIWSSRQNAQKELDELVKNNKDDKILLKYISLLEKIDNYTHEINELKKDKLYYELLDQEEKIFNTANCTIKFKKPYKRLDIDTDKFLKDNKPESKLYKKYVKEISVKGSVSITDKEE